MVTTILRLGFAAYLALGGVLLFSSLQANEAEIASDVLVDVGIGHGSGVNIGSGRILTAAHVVDGAAVIMVDTPTGQSAKASVIMINTEIDVALLQTDLQGFSSQMSCKATTVGQEIRIAGNPGEERHVQAWGHVSKAESSITQAAPYPSWPSLVTIDVTSMAGMSGGPVYDMRGKVVGVVVAGYELPVPLRSFHMMVPSTTICPLISDKNA